MEHDLPASPLKAAPVVLRDRSNRGGATHGDGVARTCRAHPAEDCDGMLLRSDWEILR